jgi:hypothetical protein
MRDGSSADNLCKNFELSDERNWGKGRLEER